MPEPVEQSLQDRSWVVELGVGALLGALATGLAVFSGQKSAHLGLAVPALVLLVWWSFGRASRWFFVFSAASLLLPPLELVSGVWVHPAVFAALLGLWSGLPQLRSWRFRNDAMTVASALFLLALLLSVPMALLYSGPEVAAGSLARVLLFAIGLYVFFYLAHGPGLQEALDPSNWMRALFALCVLSAAIACVDFHFQFAPAGPFGAQYVWLRDGVYRRAQGFFYDAGMLGNLCAFFLLFAALAWLRPSVRRRVLRRRWLLAGGVVLSAALLFSFSRSSLLNLFVGLATLLFLERGKIRIGRWMTALPAIAAGGLVSAWALFPSFVESYFDRLWLTAGNLFASPEIWLSGRLESWQALLGFLGAEPWHALFGIGFKTLPHSRAIGDSFGGFGGRPIIADNMYLSSLVETGIIGFTAMMALILAVLVTARRASRSRNETAAFLGAWVFCFWVGQLFQMMSVDVLTYWRVLPLYFGVLALAVRESRRSESRRNGEAPLTAG